MSAHQELNPKRARTSETKGSSSRNVRRRGYEAEEERKLVTAKVLENITAILLAQTLAPTNDDDSSSCEERSSSEADVSVIPVKVVHESLAVIQDFVTEAELPVLPLRPEESTQPEPDITCPRSEDDIVAAPDVSSLFVCEIPTHLEPSAALPCEEETIPGLEQPSSLPSEEESVSSEVFSAHEEDLVSSVSNKVEEDFPYDQPQVLESGMHKACCRCAYCEDDDVQSERRASCYVSDDTSTSSSSVNSEDDFDEHQTFLCERIPDTGELMPVLAPRPSSVRVELCSTSSLLDNPDSEGEDVEDRPEPVLTMLNIEPYEVESSDATDDVVNTFVCEQPPACTSGSFPDGEGSWQLWNDTTEKWESVVCIDRATKVAEQDKECLDPVNPSRSECIFCSETPQVDDTPCESCAHYNKTRKHTDSESSSDSDSSDAQCDFFQPDGIYTVDKNTGAVLDIAHVSELSRFPCLASRISLTESPSCAENRQLPVVKCTIYPVSAREEDRVEAVRPCEDTLTTTDGTLSSHEHDAVDATLPSVDSSRGNKSTIVYSTPKLVRPTLGSQVRLSDLGRQAVRSIPLTEVPVCSRPANTWASFPAPSLEDDAETFMIENVVTDQGRNSKISMVHLINLTDIAVLSVSFLMGPVTVERSLDFSKVTAATLVGALAEYARDRYTERTHTLHSFNLVVHMLKLLINLRIKTTTKGIRYLNMFANDISLIAKEIALDWVNRLDELLLHHNALDGYHMYTKIKLMTAVILAKHKIQTFQNEGFEEPIRYKVRR